ncbi:MAG TPA: hypothetical protein EYP90_00220, partial [Chromatiaceae bacterium]|nr:hypothetical protein [Chromatiaceae bacterium]
MARTPSAASGIQLGQLTELRQRFLFLLGALVVFRIGTYIPEEKLQIGRRYLLPKQTQRAGLKKGDLKIRVP